MVDLGVGTVSPFLRIDALHPLRYDLFFFFFLFSVVYHMESQGRHKAQEADQIWGLLWHGHPSPDGRACGMQACFRATVPGFRLGSQCILFTAASANHETEFLEV